MLQTSERTIRKKTQTIKKGRLYVTIGNITYLLTIIILCFLMNSQDEDDWSTLSDIVASSYPYLFMILFILLNITVFVLIKKLKLSNDKFLVEEGNDSDNLFQYEIDTLTVILILFSTSYFIRVIFDFIIGFYMGRGEYLDYQMAACSIVIFELIPTFVLLLFHRHNQLKQQEQINSNLFIATHSDEITSLYRSQRSSTSGVILVTRSPASSHNRRSK